MHRDGREQADVGISCDAPYGETLRTLDLASCPKALEKGSIQKYEFRFRRFFARAIMNNVSSGLH
jgi:hypothetical protein